MRQNCGGGRRSPVFYQGTGVIEIQHPGLGIVRYGEVDPIKQFVVVNQRVKKGQVIGLVGKRIGATRFMLHLELYRDWTKADVNRGQRLSVASKPPFQRREDLHDPTAILMNAPVQNLDHISMYRPVFQERADQLRLERLLEFVGRCLDLSRPLPK